jgi:hypothetical protein
MRNIDGFLTKLVQDDMGLKDGVVYSIDVVDENGKKSTQWRIETQTETMGIGINFKAARAAIRRMIRAKGQIKKTQK